MKIASSTIGMDSARNYVSVRMDSFTASEITGGSANKGNTHLQDNTKDSKTNQSAFLQKYDLNNRFAEIQAKNSMRFKRQNDNTMRVKAGCMDYLFLLLFGRKSNIDFNTSGFSGSHNSDVADTYLEQTSSATFFQYHFGAETTSYSTNGKVVTADGMEFTFELSFEMSRSFEEFYFSKFTQTKKISFCDPLVINLDSATAGVSDQKFMFDIDNDGTKDNISRLNPGSDYLALDLNGDGVINDGGELIGTKSGNGFADLAQYDSDGNGWIDENDEIWSKLRIWTQDEDGNDMLYGLSEKGLGAIYLGNVSTEHTLTSQMGDQVNAAIRKTGIFLYENGNVGTVQHLDLAN